jgi:hypothetical protein
MDAATSKTENICIHQFNPLKCSGYYMYHPGKHSKALHFAHKVYLCVSYGSHNKQRLFFQSLLSCDNVTIDRVWIGNQTYWTLKRSARDYALKITIIHRLVFSTSFFTSRCLVAASNSVASLASVCTGSCSFQLPCTIDSLCCLDTDSIDNIFPKSSPIVASLNYRHGPRREHHFPLTTLLRVTKLLLPSNRRVCRAAPQQRLLSWLPISCLEQISHSINRLAFWRRRGVFSVRWKFNSERFRNLRSLY